jgi:hypothetical protein
MINPVEAAKAIKAELKAKYPTRKFSVRSERFSMGNSVNVVCDEEILAQVRDSSRSMSMELMTLCRI